MPYIDPLRRKFLDPSIEELSDYLQDVGDLNYVITRLSLRLLIRMGLKYSNINNVLGTLHLAFAELYRRVAAPYEDIKIMQNTDVPELEALTLDLTNTSACIGAAKL